MITIFNRKEVCTTFDMQEQARVRNILAGNRIDYLVKIIDRTSSSSMAAGERGRAGTYGQNVNAMNEYTIYVHKKDYKKAKGLI